MYISAAHSRTHTQSISHPQRTVYFHLNVRQSTWNHITHAHARTQSYSMYTSIFHCFTAQIDTYRSIWTTQLRLHAINLLHRTGFRSLCAQQIWPSWFECGALAKRSKRQAEASAEPCRVGNRCSHSRRMWAKEHNFLLTCGRLFLISTCWRYRSSEMWNDVGGLALAESPAFCASGVTATQSNGKSMRETLWRFMRYLHRFRCCCCCKQTEHIRWLQNSSTQFRSRKHFTLRRPFGHQEHVSHLPFCLSLSFWWLMKFGICFNSHVVIPNSWNIFAFYLLPDPLIRLSTIFRLNRAHQCVKINTLYVRESLLSKRCNFRFHWKQNDGYDHAINFELESVDLCFNSSMNVDVIRICVGSNYINISTVFDRIYLFNWFIQLNFLSYFGRSIWAFWGEQVFSIFSATDKTSIRF